MKKIARKVTSLFLVLIIILGITTVGGLSENYSFLHALRASAVEAEPASLSVQEETAPTAETPEDFTTDLKDILREYDTGVPVSITIDIEDAQTSDDGTTMISAEQFSDITGDTCSASSTSDGILVQHDDYSVALSVDENLMYVNGDEYRYLASTPTEKNDEFYFPIDDVAEGLGYSVAEINGKITLMRDYQSKRILVKTAKKLADTQKAVAEAEVADNLYALQYDSELAAENACEYYRSLKSIEYAQPDNILDVQEEENTFNSVPVNTINAQIMSGESYYSWGAAAMGVGEYTDYLTSSVGASNLNSVVIAVLDTGIDTDHSWFSGRIANNGTNFSTSVSSTAYSYEDVYGHGTHVSGIISNLTMSNVKVLPVKVMNDQGYGYTSSIIQGIDYVIAQKQGGQNIYAMNLSLGMAGASAEDNAAYRDAIGDAYMAGVLTVVAAGNDGADASNSTPANILSAITVAAVGRSGSNYFCPSWSNSGSFIDLSAPGYQIESARVGGGTVLMSGTSMAAPHVAAAVALLYSNSLKTYTLPGIEDALDYFSMDLGASGWDQYYGAGMVSLENAYAVSMASVAFSKTTSECTNAFSLTLSCPETGALIYYTLDSSTPSYTNGTLYTDVINISTSARIKAVAYVFYNSIITKYSRVSSMTYYFYGQDVPNSFTVSGSGELTAYTGVLNSVTVPSSVNGVIVTSIGAYAFSSVSSTILSVTLPLSVTAINDNAFNNCTALTQVLAPSVTKIGMYAFYWCTSFQYVQDLYFPELLTIGKYAFYRCLSLQPITLNKVTIIDDWAFGMGPNAVVPNLTSVTLPAAKTIGESSFFNCNKVNSIEIPSAEIICANAFRSCNISVLSLPSAKYLGNFAFYVNSNLTSADLPEAIIIGKQCFYYYCKSLTTLNIPKVEKIGFMAFRECFALMALNLPSVEEIGDWAFYDCNNLKTVTAPQLKYVDYVAFGHCDSLEEVYMPSVVRITNEAFRVAASLTKVTLSSCIEDIPLDSFRNVNTACVFYLYGGTAAQSFAVANGYHYVDLALNKNCFQYQKINNTEVYITGYTANLPDNAEIPSYIEGLPVTKICADAFKNCSKIVKLAVSGLKEIEPSAFSNCSNLNNVCLPSIETIGEKAFYFCTGLNAVEITSAKTVGNYAFYGCSSLLSVELGADISTIGTNAFGYSADELIIPNFAVFGYAGTAAETYAENHHILFHDKFSQLSFFYFNYYQNNGQQEIYISYVNKDVKGNIIIPSTYNGYTISKIGDYAFQYCCFVTSIKLPETIKKIGSNAFDECSNLETINCEKVTSLGDYAFQSCNSLKSISLPLVTAITAQCFSDGSALIYAYLPLVTSIANAAFYECVNLRTVICPSLETISFSAFAYDQNLQSIDLQNVKTIGDQPFIYCTSLKSVNLLSAVSFGNGVFGACSSDLTLYVHKGSVAEGYAKNNNLKTVTVESLLTGVNNTVVDNDKCELYGLPPGIKTLSGYISISASCEMTYSETLRGFGTGTIVNIIHSGVTVQRYVIVIFGDVNGDGNVDSMDAGILVDIENGGINLNPVNDAVFIKAGDVNKDGNMDSIDADITVDFENNKVGINQRTGLAF